MIGVQIRFLRKHLQQITVILLPHIIIRNPKNQFIPSGCLDGKHAVIEQQTWEDIGIRNLMCRESFLQPAGYLARLGNISDNALAVAIQFVEIDKPAHLVVIRLGVGINHLLRSLTRTHVIAEIIENHIAIKHLALGFQSIRRETIVIVPGFHVTDNRLNITIRADGSLFLIIGKHLPNILR